MGKTLYEWNKYSSDLARLKDIFHEGTKTIKGLSLTLEMEDCDILFDLLSEECDKVLNGKLDFTANRLSRNMED